MSLNSSKIMVDKHGLELELIREKHTAEVNALRSKAKVLESKTHQCDMAAQLTTLPAVDTSEQLVADLKGHSDSMS